MFIWMHALKKAQAFQRMFCKMKNNFVAWCRSVYETRKNNAKGRLQEWHLEETFGFLAMGEEYVRSEEYKRIPKYFPFYARS